MTMHDADRPLDSLDRAILGLALEEPPSGLRSSILLATAYRPAPPFSFFELALLGALGAVAVWFAALLVLGGGSLFVHTVTTIGVRGERGALERCDAGMAGRGRRDGAVALTFHRFPTRRARFSQVRAEERPIIYLHGESLSAAEAPI